MDGAWPAAMLTLNRMATATEAMILTAPLPLSFYLLPSTFYPFLPSSFFLFPFPGRGGPSTRRALVPSKAQQGDPTMKLACFPILALAACLTLSPAAARAAAALQRDTETVDRTYPLGAGGELRLNNFSGKIVITGSNRGNVAIHAVRRATRERLENIHLDIQADGSRIRIDANKRDKSWDRHDDNVVETDFEIEVPDDANLDVNAFSSDIRISNVHGRQKVHSFSGGVTLRDAAGPIDAETFSGDIDVDLAPNASGRVDFDTFSGDLTSDIPMAYRSGGRRGAHGEIGSGGTNTLKFHTFSGDVHIK